MSKILFIYKLIKNLLNGTTIKIQIQNGKSDKVKLKKPQKKQSFRSNLEESVVSAAQILKISTNKNINF